MLDRRGFIGRLLASTVGLALAPKDLLWRPEPGVVGLPPVAPYAPLTLEHLTLMMHQAIRERIDQPTLVPRHPGYDLNFHDAAAMLQEPNILGVDFLAPEEVGPEGCELRYILPAAAMMAREITHRKVVRFGELPIPKGVECGHRVSCDGLSVRGLLAFGWFSPDAWLPQAVLRFDVFGGA